MNTIRTLAFAGLTVIASMGAASATPVSEVSARQFQAMYQPQGQFGAVSVIARYDRSATRGRLDLGASACHPEGPGNPND